MAEKITNKKHVKVDDETHILLDKEKNRFKPSERPTHAQIIRAALEAWVAKDVSVREPQYPSKHDKWHALLEKILGSPDIDAIACIQQILGLAVRVIQPITETSLTAEEVQLIQDHRHAQLIKLKTTLDSDVKKPEVSEKPQQRTKVRRPS